VYLYSDHLSSEQVQSAHLKKISSIEETLKMLVGRFGKETRIAVLPEGPQSLPYLSR
jgi:hypothetical protein